MKQDLICGINSVKSLLINRSHIVKELFFVDTQDNKKQELIKLAQTKNIATHKIDKKKLDGWFLECNHQGIAAKITPKKFLNEKEFFTNFNTLNRNNLFLILDGIQDPHNFGAILRTAEAFAVDAVIITKDNSVKATDVVSKVASGALEIIPIVEVVNLARFLQMLKEQGVWVVGSILESNAQSIYLLDLTLPLALIVGSEGFGIKQLTSKTCDFLAYIPLHGTIESLNVSVATGILLAEVIRQRK